MISRTRGTSGGHTWWRHTEQGTGVGGWTCVCANENGGRGQGTEKATFEQRPKLREGDTTPADRIANPKAKALSGRSPSLFFFLIFFSAFIYFWDRERQSMNGGGAEREGDTELEAGSRL